MLVLSRKDGEQIVIGADIVVSVLQVAGNRVRIGIEAPDPVRIVRGELVSFVEDPSLVSAYDRLEVERECHEVVT